MDDLSQKFSDITVEPVIEIPVDKRELRINIMYTITFRNSMKITGKLHKYDRYQNGNILRVHINNIKGRNPEYKIIANIEYRTSHAFSQ